MVGWFTLLSPLYISLMWGTERRPDPGCPESQEAAEILNESRVLWDAVNIVTDTNAEMAIREYSGGDTRWITIITESTKGMWNADIAECWLMLWISNIGINVKDTAHILARRSLRGNYRPKSRPLLRWPRENVLKGRGQKTERKMTFGKILLVKFQKYKKTRRIGLTMF